AELDSAREALLRAAEKLETAAKNRPLHARDPWTWSQFARHLADEIELGPPELREDPPAGAAARSGAEAEPEPAAAATEHGPEHDPSPEAGAPPPPVPGADSPDPPAPSVPSRGGVLL